MFLPFETFSVTCVSGRRALVASRLLIDDLAVRCGREDALDLRLELRSLESAPRLRFRQSDQVGDGDAREPARDEQLHGLALVQLDPRPRGLREDDPRFPVARPTVDVVLQLRFCEPRTCLGLREADDTWDDGLVLVPDEEQIRGEAPEDQQ